jgi:hypothetical protein
VIPQFDIEQFGSIEQYRLAKRQALRDAADRCVPEYSNPQIQRLVDNEPVFWSGEVLVDDGLHNLDTLRENHACRLPARAPQIGGSMLIYSVAGNALGPAGDTFWDGTLDGGSPDLEDASSSNVLSRALVAKWRDEFHGHRVEAQRLTELRDVALALYLDAKERRLSTKQEYWNRYEDAKWEATCAWAEVAAHKVDERIRAHIAGRSFRLEGEQREVYEHDGELRFRDLDSNETNQVRGTGSLAQSTTSEDAEVSYSGGAVHKVRSHVPGDPAQTVQMVREYEQHAAVRGIRDLAEAQAICFAPADAEDVDPWTCKHYEDMVVFADPDLDATLEFTRDLHVQAMETAWDRVMDEATTSRYDDPTFEEVCRRMGC